MAYCADSMWCHKGPLFCPVETCYHIARRHNHHVEDDGISKGSERNFCSNPEKKGISDSYRTSGGWASFIPHDLAWPGLHDKEHGGTRCDHKLNVADARGRFFSTACSLYSSAADGELQNDMPDFWRRKKGSWRACDLAERLLK